MDGAAVVLPGRTAIEPSRRKGVAQGGSGFRDGYGGGGGARPKNAVALINDNRK